MPIKYEKFFKLLKERGYSSYSMRQKKLISQAVLQKLRTGTGGKSGVEIDTRTIEKLCKLLNCQPGDLMEYIEEEK